MIKNMRKQLKNEKGLTLVELLAVIVILGIIAAIAIPAIGNIITNSKVNALKADGQNVISAANIYFTENSIGAEADNSVTVEKLITEGFLEDAGGFKGEGETDADGTVKFVTDGNQLSGTAKNGGVEVKFKNATNADITAAGTKETEGSQTVEISR